MNSPRLDRPDPRRRRAAGPTPRSGPARRTRSRARSRRRRRRRCRRRSTRCRATSSRAAIRPLVWMRPMIQPMSSVDRRRAPGRRCRPRRMTQRPGGASAESIQRLTGARAVVGVAVGAEADVDRDRQALSSLGERDAGSRRRGRCGSSRRTTSRRSWSSCGQRDEHAGDHRAPADAAVAGGDAGDVGAVRADRPSATAARARCAGSPSCGRRGDRGVEVARPRARRRSRTAPSAARPAAGACRRPGPRCARSASCPPVEEVGVGEVEAADVDDADQHALAVAVAPGVPEAPEGRRGRSGGPGLDDRGRQGQRLAELHVADVVALRELQRARHRQLGGGQAPLHGQEGAAARGRQPGVHLGAAEVDEDADPGVGQGGEVALRERPRRGVRRRRVARAGRRQRGPLRRRDGHRRGVLGAQHVHLRAAVRHHPQLGLHLARGALAQLHPTTRRRGREAHPGPIPSRCASRPTPQPRSAMASSMTAWASASAWRR